MSELYDTLTNIQKYCEQLLKFRRHLSMWETLLVHVDAGSEPEDSLDFLLTTEIGNHSKATEVENTYYQHLGTYACKVSPYYEKRRNNIKTTPLRRGTFKSVTSKQVAIRKAEARLKEFYRTSPVDDPETWVTQIENLEQAIRNMLPYLQEGFNEAWLVKGVRRLKEVQTRLPEKGYLKICSPNRLELEFLEFTLSVGYQDSFKRCRKRFWKSETSWLLDIPSHDYDYFRKYLEKSNSDDKQGLAKVMIKHFPSKFTRDFLEGYGVHFAVSGALSEVVGTSQGALTPVEGS